MQSRAEQRPALLNIFQLHDWLYRQLGLSVSAPYNKNATSTPKKKTFYDLNFVQQNDILDT